MTVRVQCPNPECGAWLGATTDDAGRRARCPKCRTSLVVPTPNGPSTELTPPVEAIPPDRMGRYEIRRKLGSGAFGVVYLAHDPVMDRAIALKIPHEGLVDTPTAVERFLREARAAAKLRHPNIVPAFDAGIEGGRYYLASAFVEGRTLAQSIDEHGLEPARAARIVRELAEALHHAHEQGIIHRDVKPSNVMLDADDHTHLMDFGLARLAGSEARLTVIGSILGTPAYLAPEQATGRGPDADPASDQYSLGVTLFELLTGQTPFVGPLEIVIFATLHQPVPSPRDINLAIDAELEAICLKALAKKPEERYANCHELAEDLGRWLSGSPIEARMPEQTPPTVIQEEVEAAGWTPVESASEIALLPSVVRRWRVPSPSKAARVSGIAAAALVVVCALLATLDRGKDPTPRVEQPALVLVPAQPPEFGPIKKVEEKATPSPDRPPDKPIVVASPSKPEKPPDGPQPKTPPLPEPGRDDKKARSGPIVKFERFPAPPELEAIASPPLGFEPLFNGKNLDGWVNLKDQSAFTVKGREIIGRAARGPNDATAILATRDHYDDFELRAKVRFVAGGASFFVRARHSPGRIVSGIEIQYDPSQYFSGHVLTPFDKNKHGNARFVVGEKKSPDPEIWYDLRISVEGKNLTVIINDELPKSYNYLYSPGIPTRGPIAIELGAGEVRIKDLWIRGKGISFAEPPDKRRPEQDFTESHFTYLYESGDPLREGWKKFKAGTFHEDGLGTLIVEGGPGQILYVRKPYYNFTLRAEFQTSWRQDESGILVRVRLDQAGNPIPSHRVVISGDNVVPKFQGGSLGSIAIGSKKVGSIAHAIDGANDKEWNQLEITLKDADYSVFVNGQRCTSWKCDQVEGPGYIGLSSSKNGEQVRYRHIRIRED